MKIKEKIDKDAQIKDLENIVKYLINWFTGGENELVINGLDIWNMEKYHLCELKNHRNRKDRIFRLISTHDYYGEKFVIREIKDE